MNSFALCSNTKNADGNYCGFQAGASTCSDKACTDAVPNANANTCFAYINNCAFNGTACAAAAACSTYNLTSAAACNAASDGAGNLCGYATGASACKAKACTDVISNPSAATCNAYLSGCLFNGTNCVTPAACNTFATSGAQD